MVRFIPSGRTTTTTRKRQRPQQQSTMNIIIHICWLTVLAYCSSLSSSSTTTVESAATWGSSSSSIAAQQTKLHKNKNDNNKPLLNMMVMSSVHNQRTTTKIHVNRHAVLQLHVRVNYFEEQQEEEEKDSISITKTSSGVVRSSSSGNDDETYFTTSSSPCSCNNNDSSSSLSDCLSIILTVDDADDDSKYYEDRGDHDDDWKGTETVLDLHWSSSSANNNNDKQNNNNLCIGTTTKTLLLPLFLKKNDDDNSNGDDEPSSTQQQTPQLVVALWQQQQQSPNQRWLLDRKWVEIPTQQQQHTAAGGGGGGEHQQHRKLRNTNRRNNNNNHNMASSSSFTHVYLEGRAAVTTATTEAMAMKSKSMRQQHHRHPFSPLTSPSTSATTNNKDHRTTTTTTRRSTNSNNSIIFLLLRVLSVCWMVFVWTLKGAVVVIAVVGSVIVIHAIIRFASNNKPKTNAENTNNHQEQQEQREELINQHEEGDDDDRDDEEEIDGDDSTIPGSISSANRSYCSSAVEAGAAAAEEEGTVNDDDDGDDDDDDDDDKGQLNNNLNTNRIATTAIRAAATGGSAMSTSSSSSSSSSSGAANNSSTGELLPPQMQRRVVRPSPELTFEAAMEQMIHNRRENENDDDDDGRPNFVLVGTANAAMEQLSLDGSNTPSGVAAPDSSSIINYNDERLPQRASTTTALASEEIANPNPESMELSSNHEGNKDSRGEDAGTAVVEKNTEDGTHHQRAEEEEVDGGVASSNKATTEQPAEATADNCSLSSKGQQLLSQPVQQTGEQEDKGNPASTTEHDQAAHMPDASKYQDDKVAPPPPPPPGVAAAANNSTVILSTCQDTDDAEGLDRSGNSSSTTKGQEGTMDASLLEPQQEQEVANSTTADGFDEEAGLTNFSNDEDCKRIRATSTTTVTDSTGSAIGQDTEGGNDSDPDDRSSYLTQHHQEAADGGSIMALREVTNNNNTNGTADGDINVEDMLPPPQQHQEPKPSKPEEGPPDTDCSLLGALGKVTKLSVAALQGTTSGGLTPSDATEVQLVEQKKGNNNVATATTLLKPSRPDMDTQEEVAAESLVLRELDTSRIGWHPLRLSSGQRRLQAQSKSESFVQQGAAKIEVTGGTDETGKTREPQVLNNPAPEETKETAYAGSMSARGVDGCEKDANTVHGEESSSDVDVTNKTGTSLPKTSGKKRDRDVFEDRQEGSEDKKSTPLAKDSTEALALSTKAQAVSRSPGGDSTVKQTGEDTDQYNGQPENLHRTIQNISTMKKARTGENWLARPANYQPTSTSNVVRQMFDVSRVGLQCSSPSSQPPPDANEGEVGTYSAAAAAAELKTKTGGQGDSSETPGNAIGKPPADNAENSKKRTDASVSALHNSAKNRAVPGKVPAPSLTPDFSYVSTLPPTSDASLDRPDLGMPRRTDEIDFVPPAPNKQSPDSDDSVVLVDGNGQAIALEKTPPMNPNNFQWQDPAVPDIAPSAPLKPFVDQLKSPVWKFGDKNNNSSMPLPRKKNRRRRGSARAPRRVTAAGGSSQDSDRSSTAKAEEKATAAAAADDIEDDDSVQIIQVKVGDNKKSSRNRRQSDIQLPEIVPSASLVSAVEQLKAPVWQFNSSENASHATTSSNNNHNKRKHATNLNSAADGEPSRTRQRIKTVPHQRRGT